MTKHLRNWLIAFTLAALVVIGGSIAPAKAEWNPRPPCNQGENYWRSHRNAPGKCGWHTVGSLVGRVFKTHAGYALCIAYRESHLDPQARNRYSGAAGLFQFLPSWWAGRWSPWNPVVNTLHAYTGSRGGTYWAPWGWAC